MPFVVDASIAATWLLPDEGNPVAEAAYRRLLSDNALVPSIWWYEMRNIFISNERRGRISSEHTARALILLGGLPIQFDYAPDSAVLMALSLWRSPVSIDLPLTMLPIWNWLGGKP